MMIREEDVPGGVYWCCTVCGHSSKKRTQVALHVEAKHIESNGFHCKFAVNTVPVKMLFKHMYLVTTEFKIKDFTTAVSVIPIFKILLHRKILFQLLLNH